MSTTELPHQHITVAESRLSRSFTYHTDLSTQPSPCFRQTILSIFGTTARIIGVLHERKVVNWSTDVPDHQLLTAAIATGRNPSRFEAKPKSISLLSIVGYLNCAEDLESIKLFLITNLPKDPQIFIGLNQLN